MMETQIVTTPQGTEIRLKGRLTFDDLERFNEVKALSDGRAGQSIVFDLSALEFIDSAGLGMLVVFADQAGTRGIAVRTRGAGGIVRKLMDLVQFDSVIRPLD
jgi:stage II sporulation protein AA (anti-sigma F factor antagonist)